MLKDQCIMLQEGGFEAKPHIQALMSSSSSSSYSVSAHTQQQHQQQQAQQGPAALRALVKPNAAEQEVLKCPRCDSTNTKFCYYNNYSLTQPRHFCKTCRRYWTKGGSLRSVPVGGGCRKNSKRSTPTSSNSGNCGLIKSRNGDQVNMGQPSHTSFLATTTAQSHLAEVSSCYNGVDPELGIMNFVGLRAQQPPAHTQSQVDEHLFVGSSNNVFEGFQPYHLSHNLTALQSLQSQFLGASESMNGLPQTGNYRGLINTTAELSLVAHDTTPQSHQSHEVYNPYLNISLDQPSLDVRATNTRNNNNGISTSTNNFEPPHYWNGTTTSAAPSWPPTDFSAYGFSGLNPSSM